MAKIARFLPILLIGVALYLVVSGLREPTTSTGEDPATMAGDPDRTLSILSGSENESLEPIVEAFCASKGWSCPMSYRGSVDIMLALEDPGPFPSHAVWPADSRWIDLGDKQRRVRHLQSIMTSPVALAVRRDKAEDLGLVGRDVTWADLAKLVADGRLRFTMTSATQSNSGFSAYIAMLTALAAPDDRVLNDADLKGTAAQEQVKTLLSGVVRTSGSSGWLKQLYLDNAADPTIWAMFNYESLIIEANQELTRRNAQPLYAIYPVDGVAFSDSPLGYIAPPQAGDVERARESLFLELQQHLLTQPVQDQLLQLGRRTGIGGGMDRAPRAVFNPDWGIDPARILNRVTFPNQGVIRAALTLYQEALRKPSLLALCLDYSGSMTESIGQEGRTGEQELEEAIRQLFDLQVSARYLLQAGQEDQFLVLPFNHQATTVLQATGPQEAARLVPVITRQEADGGTDMYGCGYRAMEALQAIPNRARYTTGLVMMTDGRSEEDNREAFLTLRRQRFPDLPVFGITFGNADDSQLRDLAMETRARVFDGRKGLSEAMRQARSYN